MTTHANRTHVASKNTSTSTKLLVLRRRRHSFVKSLQNLHHNTVMHECFLMRCCARFFAYASSTKSMPSYSTRVSMSPEAGADRIPSTWLPSNMLLNHATLCCPFPTRASPVTSFLIMFHTKLLAAISTTIKLPDLRHARRKDVPHGRPPFLETEIVKSCTPCKRSAASRIGEHRTAHCTKCIGIRAYEHPVGIERKGTSARAHVHTPTGR